jgi:hypothetical protein
VWQAIRRVVLPVVPRAAAAAVNRKRVRRTVAKSRSVRTKRKKGKAWHAFFWAKCNNKAIYGFVRSNLFIYYHNLYKVNRGFFFLPLTLPEEN